MYKKEYVYTDCNGNAVYEHVYTGDWYEDTMNFDDYITLGELNEDNFQ